MVAIETESIPECVEHELVMWLRRRLMIPGRLTLKTGAMRPLAAYLANKGNASGRGEAFVVHLRPDAGSKEAIPQPINGAAP